MSIEILQGPSQRQYSFLDLRRASRVQKYLRMTPGVAESNYIYGQDGSYLELPIGAIEVSNASKGITKLTLVADVMLEPALTNEYKYLFEPNPALWQYGMVQGSYYMNGGEGRMTPRVIMYIAAAGAEVSQAVLGKIKEMYLERIYLRV